MANIQANFVDVFEFQSFCTLTTKASDDSTQFQCNIKTLVAKLNRYLWAYIMQSFLSFLKRILEYHNSSPFIQRDNLCTGEGGYPTSFLWGGSVPRAKPLPFYIPFLTEKGTPFQKPSVENGTPFLYLP